MPPKEDKEKWTSLFPFTGKDPALAPEWLDKFQMKRERKGWEDADALYHFKSLMTQGAYTWLKTLDAGKKDTYENLLREFTSSWIESEPRVVVERRLESRRLQVEKGESIETYRAAIVELGSKIGRTGDALCNDFLRGLTEQVREYCLQSDTHTLDSYVKRAKLFVAYHPVAPATESVNAIGRGRSPHQSTSKGKNRGRSPSHHRDNSGDRSRGHSKMKDICYLCHKPGHYARECRSSQKSVRNRSPGVRFKEGGKSSNKSANKSFQKSDGKSSGKSRVSCFVCGGPHIARFCPDRYQSDSGTGQESEGELKD